MALPVFSEMGITKAHLKDSVLYVLVLAPAIYFALSRRSMTVLFIVILALAFIQADNLYLCFIRLGLCIFCVGLGLAWSMWWPSVIALVMSTLAAGMLIQVQRRVQRLNGVGEEDT
jgi:hypothetical protein